MAVITHQTMQVFHQSTTFQCLLFNIHFEKLGNIGACHWHATSLNKHGNSKYWHKLSNSNLSPI